jgi:asparaginyl-tRNA synthetase
MAALMTAIPTVSIGELASHVGSEVRLRGWVYQKRSSGKVRFLVVRDGSGYCQCVAFVKDVPPDLFDLCDRLTQESSLAVTGIVRKDDRAPGGHEMSITGIEPVQIIPESEPYPIQPKEHGVEFLLDHRHLWLRSSRPHATLRVRDEVEKTCRDFFYDRGFTLIDSPIFTPAACEGTTTLFETDYFGEKAYLTQSGQLYLEPACQAFGKVYCFGPTFRAEKSKTRRHLTEFWMIEPEIAWAGLPELLELAEDLIVTIVGRVLDRRREDLKRLERDLAKLEAVQKPFPRLRYDDAARILTTPEARAKAEASGAPPFEPGNDLGAADETILAECHDRPLMLTHYPADVKSFYMQPDPSDPSRAECVDILAPEGYGEIVGGSVRIHDLELLKSRIAEQGLPLEAFKWYLDVRKFGAVPHGVRQGIERVVGWLCGHPPARSDPHPRTSAPLPRPRASACHLGCPKNLVESEVMMGRARLLPRCRSAEAEIVVVNTCGVHRRGARGVGRVLEAAELKKSGRCRRLVVAGCLVQRAHADLQREIPEIDAFVGLDDIPRILGIAAPELVGNGSRPATAGLRSPALLDIGSSAPAGRRDQGAAADVAAATGTIEGPATWIYDHDSPRLLSGAPHAAYLKISEGCDRPCAFCAIPTFRGAYRSRRLGSILEEADALATRGVRELNLIAQDSTHYGADLGFSDGPARLLRALDQVAGLHWIRLSSIERRDPVVPGGGRRLGARREVPRHAPAVRQPLRSRADEARRERRSARAAPRVDARRDPGPRPPLDLHRGIPRRDRGRVRRHARVRPRRPVRSPRRFHLLARREDGRPRPRRRRPGGGEGGAPRAPARGPGSDRAREEPRAARGGPRGALRRGPSGVGRSARRASRRAGSGDRRNGHPERGGGRARELRPGRIAGAHALIVGARPRDGGALLTRTPGGSGRTRRARGAARPSR